MARPPRIRISRDFPSTRFPMLDAPVEVTPGGTLHLASDDARLLDEAFAYLAGENRCAPSTLMLDGADISSLDALQRARGGLACASSRVRVLPSLTVAEHVRLRLDGLRANLSVPEAVALAKQRFAALADAPNVPCGNLSGGQQQALMLALATIAPPRLLVIEEPWAGLSPAARREAAALFGALTSAGTSCIFLLQDAMDEGERVPGRVTWLSRPRAV